MHGSKNLSKQTLGNFLKERREKHFPFINQKEFAKRAGVAQHYISRYECCFFDDISKATINKLAEIYRVSIEDIEKVLQKD